MSKKNINNTGQSPQSPYGIDKISRIRPGVKIGFLKFWLGGAVFLLSFMTIFYSNDMSNEFLVAFLLLTLGTEYVSNKFILWMDHPVTPTIIYLPFGYIDRRRLLSLLSSMLYALIALFSVSLMYIGLHWLLGLIGNALLGYPIYTGMILSFGGTDTPDPITIGLLFLLFDFIWVSIRRLIKKRQNKNITKGEK